MIKNSPKSSVFVALIGVFLSSCHRTNPADSAYQGVVELDEWVLGFELTGRISSLGTVRGAAVDKGQRLAQLDATLEATTRAAREDDADAARAQLALLKAGSRAEDLRSVEAQVRAARATADTLAKSLAREK
jgi:HlyD family secretion protein